MGSFVDFAARCVRAVYRRLKHSEDFFPLDAWTQCKEYASWFESARVSDQELQRQKADRAVIEGGPLFSIIVPLYKTPLEFLHSMVDSVLSQSYPHFELILVNASPEIQELTQELDEYLKQDSRIKQVVLDRNYGITENTNRGIEIATGEFCAFLDHDDFIEPNLLYEYALAVRNNPDTDVLYCDEDLVEKKNDGFCPLHPLFKPDYSPELLLCTNYIIHLLTVRRSLIDRMPVRDSRYDGAQDYNMVQFATSHARVVHHVPKVLYRWRISNTSTALNPDAKPYGQLASRISAYNLIKVRTSNSKIVASGIPSTHNVWFIGSKEEPLSLIVDCTKEMGSADLFLQFLIQCNSYSNIEIVLVGSDNDIYLNQEYSELEVKRAVLSQPGGNLFSHFNYGAKYACGKHLIFLDSTCFFITPEPFEQLSGLVRLDGVGAAAPKLLYANGLNRMYGIAVTPERIMPLYRGYPDDFPGYQCNLRAFQNASAASCLGLCVKRSLFERVGGFNESYEGEIGSADFCQKIMHEGKRIVLTPTVKLQTGEACPKMQYDLATNASEFIGRDLELFDRLWPGVREAGDPFFNPNLDQSSGYFQVAGTAKY